MAEGFEPYHVPQQSRRDKLRVLSSQTSLIPLLDPSFLSSDLLSSAAHHFNKPIPVPLAKQQGLNLMPFVNSSSSSSASSDVVTTSTHHHHQCLDPQSCSFPLNPTSFLDINAASHPFLFNQLRDFDHAFGASVTEPLPFKSHALSSTSAQALSLSLSSHHTHQPNPPLELNLERYGAAVYATDKVSSSTGDGGYSVAGIVGSSSNLTSNELPRSSVPLGPFTGYAFILKGSKFLKPAQQLLEEFCDVGRDIYGEKFTADSSLMDHPAECLSACGVACDPHCRDGGDGGRKTSRLISMLDEVCRRYRHYYQQTQAMMASFECVAGLSNAAPYASLAFKAMSKHFRSLKNAITDQLQFNSKGHSQVSHGKEDATRFGNSDKGLYVQRLGQSSGLGEHQPVWRPQRGLPERAVTVLRAWLFEHFLHPYPTDTDKLMLAKQTGLSRSQVSNWFINARVRLWKPMVEEIHMLETRQARKTAQREEKNSNKSSEQPPVSCSAISDNPSTSGQRVQDIPPKRTKNGLPDMPPGNEEALNLSYNNMSNHPPPGVGIGTICGSSGVSLTLGLHQSNGMGLSEPFPMNAAQRFGLGPETDAEGFVVGGFQVQNRHFGGHLMHDFVG